MKKILVSAIFAVLAVLTVLASAISCQSEIETYRGEAGIYFAMRVESNSANVDTMYTETTSLPFIITEDSEAVLNIKMKILGPVSDRDRYFRIEVVDEETTALAEDYDPVAGEHVLRAGEVFGTLPIRFHRTPSLQGHERQLKIRLVANSDFSLPITHWRNSNTEYVNVIEHTILVSDKFVQLPGYQTAYFGPFSEKKMRLILDLFDLELKDFEEPLTYTYAKALGQELDRYLRAEKAAGRTVYEDDCTEMTAGDYIYN